MISNKGSAATAVLAACGLVSSGLGIVPVALASSSRAAATISTGLEAYGDCSGIARLKIAGVDIVSSTDVSAGSVLKDTKTFLGAPVSGPAAFCRVIGRAHPAEGSNVGFEVWMPRNGWNGRLHAIGIGGFAGIIDHGSLATAVAGGQVGLATDTGHQGAGVMDATWAKGHPERVSDYGSRAVHASTVAAKSIIKFYYGHGPEHSYYVGCSGGGRQGLMEAALFPDDYDGILAGAPAASWTDTAIAMTNVAQAQFPASAAIRGDQAQFLQEEVIRQCDAIDGQVDSLIADPRQCRFDTAKLACGVSSSTHCFSGAQVGALNRIYAGPRTKDGRQLTATYLPAGAEAGYLGWPAYISADVAGHSGAQAHADGLFQNFIQTPFPTAAQFDFDRDPARLKALVGHELDVPANLHRFFARGGKLVMWHGWGDGAIPPGATLRFRAAMLTASGATAGASSRLFMVPNVQHCWGGDGPASFGQNGAPPMNDTPRNNLVAALQQWVERRQAPEQVVATLGFSGFHGQPPEGEKRQRLLCAWPAKSTLTPGADPYVAASYACVRGTE